jgi:hypothetical protein
MFSAKTAGFLAIGSSTGALITVCFYLPALISKIGSINEKVSEVNKGLELMVWGKKTGTF